MLTGWIDFANLSGPNQLCGSAVVTLAVLSISLACHLLGIFGGANAESKEEKKHWEAERSRKRILVEECVQHAKTGTASPIRIWEAIYDEAENVFVTSAPFSLQHLAHGGLPTGWFPTLVETFGGYTAVYLKQCSSALIEAETQVQKCLRDGVFSHKQHELEEKRNHRRVILDQLAETVKNCEAVVKAFRVHCPPANLSHDFYDAFESAKSLLKEQEEIRRGLTWDIGRRVINIHIACWLVPGIAFKILMGMPAPLQVLSLADAANGLEKGGVEGHEQFVTAIRNSFYFFCLEKLLQFLARVTMIRAEFLFTQTLQRIVYSKMLEQDYEFFDGKPTATLQNLVHESTKQVCSSLIFMRVRIIQALATVFFQVVLLAWKFPKLAFIVNLSLPIAALCRYVAKDYIETTGARLKARGNLVGQRTWDVLANLTTVRAHCREQDSVEDYMRCVAYQSRILTKLDILSGTVQPLLHFFDMVCVYVGYYYGGSLVRNSAMTTAELVTIIRQFQNVSSELAHMLDTISGSMLATEHGRDLRDLLRSRPRIEHEFDTICRNKTRAKITCGSIEFSNVCFSYPGAARRAGNEDVRVLRGLSFCANEGELTAIVGKTGGGKTTIVNLLQRFYDVDEGSVRVGGRDIREHDVHALRRSIAVVSQEPVLFHTSIYDNLLYSIEESVDLISKSPLETEMRLVEACKKADAWNFINAMPEGLRTDIGPRGSQLSGGQKQRLTIARAILKNSHALVLDEATSSLDVEAEQAVQQALDHLILSTRGGDENPSGDGPASCLKTRLVVAHRLSTVRKADKIVVLDGGVASEQGTHDDLLAMDGVYARFLRISGGMQASNGTRSGELSSNGVDCDGKRSERGSSQSTGVADTESSEVAAPGPVAASYIHQAVDQLDAKIEALCAKVAGDAEASLLEDVRKCQQRLRDLL